MNHTTTTKQKRIFIKHLSKIMIGFGLLLILSSMLMRLTAVGKNESVDVRQFVDNIEESFTKTVPSTPEWLTVNNDSLYLTRFWKLERPKEWDERQVSYLLYKDDSLVLWSNYIFTNDLNPKNLESNIAERCGQSIIILRKYSRGNKSVIVSLCLYNEVNGLNSNIFSNTNLDLYCTNEDIGRTDLTNVDGMFFIKTHPGTNIPLTVSIMSWLGVLILMIGIKRFFRSRTNTRNAFRIGLIYFGVTVFGGLFFTITDLFIYKNLLSDSIILEFGGGKMSVANFLIIFVFILVYCLYLYRIRCKLAYRYKQLCDFQQYVALGIILIAINAVVVFFHYGMVNVIYHTSINIELYKFTLIDQGTVVFYLIGSIFVASRILVNAVVRSVFSNQAIITSILISVVILTLMILPIQNEIKESGPILVAFHTLFIMLALFEKKNKGYNMFVAAITVFATYIMLLATIESDVITENNAKIYATKLEGDATITKAEADKYQKMTYIKIKDNIIELKENNSFDIQQLAPLFDSANNSTMTIGGYKHYIHHAPNDQIIIVSRARISLLDYIAFFAYIYIVLYLVAGGFLRLAGYKYSPNRQKGKIVLRIRFAVIGVVLFTMGLVIIVITINTFNNYDNSQRKIVNNQMMSVLSSFKQYSKRTDLQGKELLVDWFKENWNSKDRAAILYDTEGNLLISSLPSDSTYDKINAKAYSSLYWHKLPYYNEQIEYGDKTYNSAFIPVSHDNEVLGYINVTQLDRINKIASDPRFDVLVHILNILIVVVLIAVILSMSLYRMLTVPLNKLYMGMGEISALRRIEESDGGDEIATLIRQYNRMIDYLEESYEALARSEREGAWREMARQVAHEIKNPLTPMRLKIQMLQRSKNAGDQQLSEKIDNTLEILLEQIDLLAKIASEFSDFAKMNDPQNEHLDIAKLLSTISELYKDNENVTFVVEPITEKLSIRADHSQISRVLINLCQNSIQAIAGMPEGKIILSAQRIDDSVVIKVIDNGPGISEQSQKKIFQPNFTTKTSGSGLGLAISRQIILNSGGNIYFESEEGVGTSFIIVLPFRNKTSDIVSSI